MTVFLGRAVVVVTMPVCALGVAAANGGDAALQHEKPGILKNCRVALNEALVKSDSGHNEFASLADRFGEREIELATGRASVVVGDLFGGFSLGQQGGEQGGACLGRD